MLFATMLDEPLLERLILGFREEELEIPGWTMSSVERKQNSLTWVFIYDPGCKNLVIEYCAIFDGVKVIKFNSAPPIIMCEGDTLELTYTLSWYHRGGGEDEFVRLPPSGSVGLELELILCA